MTDILVRPALPEDYEAIGRICVAAYRADGQIGPGTEFYAAELRDAAARASAGEMLVAAGPGGQVLGAVLVVQPGSRYAELARPGEIEFRALAVDPAAQGRGVGQALVEGCIERARAHNARAIVISVRDFARPAQRLYARLGFVRAPELDWQPRPEVRLLGLRLLLDPAASLPEPTGDRAAGGGHDERHGRDLPTPCLGHPKAPDHDP